ncbi:MAG TPA: DNA polymerase IV [Amycolatopsis sp.]|uniref:DNA polymerase IV n=1 Tax=Amycolatopsis sp. TaxID=37632 RepID=UPI002B492B0F|nr:DNA polymerase IV [Amycolatopsis sp.]HKS49552.1 DNA polymerase IV [Amycolatopsis sp.]
MGKKPGPPAGYDRFRVTGEATPDDTGCGLLHVDMDAFFAAVEMRSRPELAGKPVIIAGAGPRSVVSSASYPAREFGVRAAMPAAVARRLCPHAMFIPPSHGLYGEVSRGVMAIFRELTPLVEPLSLDEAFLDVGGALRRLNATPVELAELIRRRVAAEHGITCSVGVAAVKFVAKLASGMAKPDGVFVVPAARTLEFLHPLPIAALWGVGKRTEESLRRMGLATIADIAGAPPNRLRRAVGNAAAEHLHALANGYDERGVVVDTPDKSIGAEHTFDTDQRDRRVLELQLLRLSEQVAARLRARGLRGRTVSIKVRFADFKTITRARTLAAPTDVTRVVHTTAVSLLGGAVSGAEIRLLGVRVDGLAGDDEPEQLSFERDEPRWRDAEIAADVARSRFGSAAVRPASLLARKSDRPT